MPKRKGEQPGPVADRVNIDGDWKDAVKDALQKKRPKDGWPKPEKKEKRQPE